ncbi:MAG: MutS-related protein, partial [Rhodospirillaceae bacterium]
AATATRAEEGSWCRPIVEASLAFDIVGGRHPVVETALKSQNTAAFVANDCDLESDRRLWLLTGPNMAGKSTFLRQNALIAILAQIGCPVPADQARIGVVDRLFSRVGASDDLARGQSTFMVEMVETAAILNQATERSLVILDEIGRGTATYDGLSIAWATVEHLHDLNRCRTLFATHYHEMTALAARLPRLSCRSMRVKEWKGKIVFLHEVTLGAADRSYGIHVAKLAGLPKRAIQRAETVLKILENAEGSGPAQLLAEDMPLFAAAAPAPLAEPVRDPEETGAAIDGPMDGDAADGPLPASAVEAVWQALAATDPDALSPRDALEALYRLKALANEASGSG